MKILIIILSIFIGYCIGFNHAINLEQINKEESK